MWGGTLRPLTLLNHAGIVLGRSHKQLWSRLVMDWLVRLDTHAALSCSAWTLGYTKPAPMEHNKTHRKRASGKVVHATLAAEGSSAGSICLPFMLTSAPHT